MSGQFAIATADDYIERVHRCITQMQNTRTRPMFQGKVLVDPSLLNEWYSCMWEYLNEYAPPGQVP